MTFKAIALGALLAAAALPAWAGDAKLGQISITNAWARASAGAAPNGAAFLTLTNAGADGDQIVGAHAPVAAHAELHTHEKDGDVMKMRQVQFIQVPAGKAVSLEPGGLHVMLMGLNAPLKEGGAFPLTLKFAKGGEVTVSVDIKAPGAMAPMAGHNMQHGKH